MRLFLALGLVCLALPVPTALGATASVVARFYEDPTGEGCSHYAMCEYFEVVVAAAPGEVNDVSLRRVDGAVELTDKGAPLTAGEGCDATPAGVSCPPIFAVVRAGDMDDAVTIAGDVAAEARGGPGADVLSGGPAGDILFGGPGDDLLDAGAGADTLHGGSGADRLLARGGKDTIFARDGARDAVHGGPGRDEARVDRGVDRLRSVTSLF